MDFDSIGAFALFLSAGGVGIGLIWLAAFRMKLKAKMEQERLGSAPGQALEELREEVHAMFERQEAMMAELHERLDFTERRFVSSGRSNDPNH